MKWLYLFLDLGTLFFPLVLSFDKRVYYFSKWKSTFIASFCISIPFILWDIYFTHKGIWGFNPDYLCGINIANLPLEEVLFFFVVPFACTFIYECCKYYVKHYSFKWTNKVLFIVIPFYAILLTLLDSPGTYTLWVIFASMFVLLWWMIKQEHKYIGISFIISMIPFLTVNGVLTGSATDSPVVWYNELEKVQPRIFTIPMEDVLYSFTLIVSVILLMEHLEKRRLS